MSDKLNGKMGMRGRLAWQGILLLLEGAMVFIFSNSNSLGVAIFVMVIFSVMVQSAEGSTYGEWDTSVFLSLCPWISS